MLLHSDQPSGPPLILNRVLAKDVERTTKHTGAAMAQLRKLGITRASKSCHRRPEDCEDPELDGRRPHTMLIACLGWGSLVWDPRKLPIRGTWFTDGPFLPIKLLAVSGDGRITLVLVPDTFPVVQSLWAAMSITVLDDAREVLEHEKTFQTRTPLGTSLSETRGSSSLGCCNTNRRMG